MHQQPRPPITSQYFFKGVRNSVQIISYLISRNNIIDF